VSERAARARDIDGPVHPNQRPPRRRRLVRRLPRRRHLLRLLTRRPSPRSPLLFRTLASCSLNPTLNPPPLRRTRAAMGYAQLVIGPAGSGKSTYCSSLYDHCQTVGRSIHIVNLDPAAEHFNYPVDMDIRELISLDDVMEDFGMGPNGGLIYCMEHLEDSLDDWLDEQLENYLDDDYLVFDCPGQIELFTHVPVLRNFVEHLKRKNFNVCAVYLLDSQFVSDVTKYISGCMASLSAMIQLELPHINILSKMDLVSNKKDVEEYLDPNAQVLLSQLNRQMAPRFGKLNKSLAELVDDYSMVNFIPLDLRKESSIQYVLSSIDSCIQYGEDADVKVRDFDLPEDDD
jgi:GTPase SAR1 family protein